MGDFGTAIIFFVTFLVISFLRSGDFTKLILIVGVAFVGGLMVLKFKSYIAERFAVWGHVWDFSEGMGYQQTKNNDRWRQAEALSETVLRKAGLTKSLHRKQTLFSVF